MIDFEARKVIEALRSGVSSKSVGQYFSSARPEVTKRISDSLDSVRTGKNSGGMILSGKYGEGKTHLLNTVYNLAHSENMVVSLVTLSKESPFDKPYLIYQKIMQNTYLPKRLQPGFLDILSDISPNSPLATELQAYTAKHLETDKLFYLFRAYLNTDDLDEKYLLLADLEGDFIGNAVLKRIYKRIFSEKVTYNTTFSKTKHMDDYFSMLSHLFLQLGYSGWVILFDETELIGRLGKKARLKAYTNMASFLFPEETSRIRATYSIFAVASSYIEDVIDGKHEFENLNEAEDAEKAAAQRTLEAICGAKQLQPLTKDEIALVMDKLKNFYRRAYDWEPEIDMAELEKDTDGRGFLLRTKIRASVERLDQLYQYGKLGDIEIDELGGIHYDETLPELDALSGDEYTLQ
ncbi:MAG: ATP-binding protein [Oscillospiraceae bacterium]|nr:ATP-binding protein [Oscillospiraceae bacterium]